MTEAAGAARAVAAILRHAAAERDGLVSVRTDGDELVVASPGETSLLMARLPLPGDGLDGSFAPATGDPPKDADALSLSAARTGLAVQLGRRRLTLRRIADGPVEVEWVWPATAPTVEAVVSRDRLLEALPSRRGPDHVRRRRPAAAGAGRPQRAAGAAEEPNPPSQGHRNRCRLRRAAAAGGGGRRRCHYRAGRPAPAHDRQRQRARCGRARDADALARAGSGRAEDRRAAGSAACETGSETPGCGRGARRRAGGAQARGGAAGRRPRPRRPGRRSGHWAAPWRSWMPRPKPWPSWTTPTCRARADQLRAALRDLLSRSGDAT